MKEYIYQGTITQVIDGDTFDIQIDLGFYILHNIRVRLLDVDTPEVYGTNACEEGKNASKVANHFCPPGTKVTIETFKTGKYGRWLAKVYLQDERCINTIMSNYKHFLQEVLDISTETNYD